LVLFDPLAGVGGRGPGEQGKSKARMSARCCIEAFLVADDKLERAGFAGAVGTFW
jgi:hypothetical protein